MSNGSRVVQDIDADVPAHRVERGEIVAGDDAVMAVARRRIHDAGLARIGIAAVGIEDRLRSFQCEAWPPSPLYSPVAKKESVASALLLKLKGRLPSTEKRPRGWDRAAARACRPARSR